MKTSDFELDDRTSQRSYIEYRGLFKHEKLIFQICCIFFIYFVSLFLPALISHSRSNNKVVPVVPVSSNFSCRRRRFLFFVGCLDVDPDTAFPLFPVDFVVSFASGSFASGSGIMLATCFEMTPAIFFDVNFVFCFTI